MTQSPNPQPARERIWDVGSLCLAVADALDARFNPVTVRGELAAVTLAASGHRYFTLKDGGGQIRCAMFRRASAALDFVPREGDAVDVRGRLGVYEARGDLQLVVESMRRSGAGSLFEQFMRLKERLQAEGLFDAARKRPIPAMPRALAVVTSLGAAALRDVTSALARRVPHVPVYVFPASVQGATAPSELIQALGRAQRDAQRLDVDAILLVRGGGPIEDLWAFNDEALARAITDSTLPVISGVGHESDFTIADFCVDLRAPTPTAAAELAATPRSVANDVVDGLGERLRRVCTECLDKNAQAVDLLAERMGRPSVRLLRQGARLDQLLRELTRSVAAVPTREHLYQARWRDGLATVRRTSLQRAVQGLESLQLRLELLNPVRVMERGYAILQDEEGRCVVRASTLQPGQSLRAALVDGEVDLSVRGTRRRASA